MGGAIKFLPEQLGTIWMFWIRLKKNFLNVCCKSRLQPMCQCTDGSSLFWNVCNRRILLEFYRRTEELLRCNTKIFSQIAIFYISLPLKSRPWCPATAQWLATVHFQGCSTTKHTFLTNWRQFCQSFISLSQSHSIGVPVLPLLKSETITTFLPVLNTSSPMRPLKKGNLFHHPIYDDYIIWAFYYREKFRVTRFKQSKGDRSVAAI